MPTFTPAHAFDLTALRDQLSALARQVHLIPLSRWPVTVAGVDAAIAGDDIVAVAVLFDLATLSPLEHATCVARLTLPYIPGFLAFREGPAMAAAVRQLTRPPELLIVDGQGLAHPLRCGLACYLGVDLGIPALGCAKSRLIGRYEEPATERGARSTLIDHDETIGAVVRTRRGVKPVFVSPGHLLTLDDAVTLVMQTTSGFRLPEPQRAADRYAAEFKKQLKPDG